jgi:uncharacterized protein (UPF0179 family)
MLAERGGFVVVDIEAAGVLAAIDSMLVVAGESLDSNVQSCSPPGGCSGTRRGAAERVQRGDRHDGRFALD